MASIAYVDQNADLVGTVAGTFAIVTGTNDKLDITIDGGSVVHVTLTAGATQTAAQVATDIQTALTAAIVNAIAVATPSTCPQPNRVRIRTGSANGATSTILIGSPANNANTTLGLAAGTYTGFGRTFVSFAQTLGTKQELLNEIETVLLSVGWTTISGHATTSLLMQSALTPPGENLQTQLLVKAVNTNCVSISIQNVAGTVVGGNSASNGAMLLPAVGKTWEFFANKYQCVVHTPPPYGNNATGRARAFAAWGIPTLPSFLQGLITECMWLSGSTGSDTDATITRSDLGGTLTHIGAVGFLGNNFQTILNGTLVDWANNGTSSALGGLSLMSIANYWNGSFPGVSIGTAYRWHDGSPILQSAVVGWGSSGTSELMYRGQLWDSVVSSDAYAGDSPISLDGHTWFAVTDNNTGAFSSLENNERGTWFVVKV